ncbi:hypothetical protein TNCV_2409961 [Trichonephila clavipes]|nr:hypothetical protein TNCV_2409961 [Trichonephila clavipes]
MVLKANDRRSSCPCHDEFRGPRSDYVRQARFNKSRAQKSIEEASGYFTGISSSGDTLIRVSDFFFAK